MLSTRNEDNFRYLYIISNNIKSDQLQKTGRELKGIHGYVRRNKKELPVERILRL